MFGLLRLAFFFISSFRIERIVLSRTYRTRRLQIDTLFQNGLTFFFLVIPFGKRSIIRVYVQVTIKANISRKK